MSDALLEVDGLRRSFVRGRGLGRPPDVIHAVQDVSFALAPGEWLGLVGESGCGKSTVARLVLRLIEADAGAVRFEGRDIGGLRGAELRALRRRMQIVFQDPAGALNPRLSVGQAIGEVLQVHGLARGAAVAARVASLLERVGLQPSHAAAYPHRLSGGQRQRVGIARALALEPRLLVCDEPVSALDVSVQAQILNLLGDLRTDLGLASLFISHDLRVVRQVCHRVAVMYLGRIVEIGPVEELFTSPRHPYTQALLAAVPDPIPGRRPVAAVAGDLPSPRQVPSGCAFHPRCPLVRPECPTAVPAIGEVAPGHAVACVLYPDRRPARPSAGSAAAGR